MSIRSWLVRHAKALAVVGGVLTSSGAAKAQFLPLPLPFPLPVTATTDKGSLIGQSTNGIRQFKGIPYAAPPTGARRWKAPAAESAYFLRDASKFAKHCAQPASPFGQASTNEDCLYLNVYSPAASLALTLQPAPVMVWFHPGAFQNGESDDYDPTTLVKKGVVVVTVNYRLGALGFMAHPALTAESSRHASGNYGLQDQQAALRWVQRNIRNFDGDPKKVTIFGQDAGGVSVYAHLASPDSAGLFQRAIAQSGSYIGYYPQKTLAAAEADGQQLATAVGCAQQDLNCLRAAPVSALLANQGNNVLFVPPVDGAVLPEGILSAFAQGHFNRVPVLHGWTREEARWYVALRELAGFPVTDIPSELSNAEALLNVTLSPQSWLITHYGLFPHGTYSQALSAAMTDIAFACRGITLSHHLAQYVPVYTYQFMEQTSPQDILPPVSFTYQTYHGADVQYLLDAADGPAPLSTDQQKTAENVKNYWTAFAKNGNPNNSKTPSWPAYQDTTGETSLQPEYYMMLQTYPVTFGQWYLNTEHRCGEHGDEYTWTFDTWNGQ